MFHFEDLKKDPDGLIPVIVQDADNGEVLMLAYMNKEAYEQTLREGIMCYWSRSRQELWRKGDTSGHYQYLKEIRIDCDLDTILVKVDQIGAACHTGHRSCFYRACGEQNSKLIDKVIDNITYNRKTGRHFCLPVFFLQITIKLIMDFTAKPALVYPVFYGGIYHG